MVARKGGRRRSRNHWHSLNRHPSRLHRRGNSGYLAHGPHDRWCPHQSAPDKPSDHGATSAIASPQVLSTLRCGDVVEAPIRIRLPERYRDPGAWQYADYLLAQGIGAHASVPVSKIALLNEPTARHATPTDRSGQLQCKIYASQSWASKRLLGYAQSAANQSLPKPLRLSPDDTGMLNAMLFGDRVGLNKAQRIGFERTGSFHLFVVSGMHVGLLAGLLFWLAQKLRLREWLATPLILTLTFGYALLTGFGAPVQRALFMTASFWWRVCSRATVMF